MFPILALLLQALPVLLKASSSFMCMNTSLLLRYKKNLEQDCQGGSTAQHKNQT